MEVTISAHLAQRFPAAEHLEGPGTDSRHNEPTGECVAIAVPCVAVEPGVVLAGVADRRASLLDG